MIKTLSIRDLENKADNIYEAIIVLAKRARQINADQKLLLAKEQDYDDDFDEFDEYDVQVRDEDIVILPKPSHLSLTEFLDGKIRYDYGHPAEEDKGSSTSG